MTNPQQTILEAAMIIAAAPGALSDWSAHRRRLEGAQIRLPRKEVVAAVELAGRIRRGER